MKWILLMISCVAFFARGQNTNSVKGKVEVRRSESLFSKKYLYFICRGSQAKEGIVAKQFNVSDPLATHVAVGIVDSENNFSVIHISDECDTNGVFFRKEILQDFLSGDGIHYAAMWRCKISGKTSRDIEQKIKQVGNCNIKFDNNFDLQTDSAMYCSEFCVKVLPVYLRKKWKINAVHKKLHNRLLETLLDRKTLVYYPVDFFQRIKNAKLMWKWSVDE